MTQASETGTKPLVVKEKIAFSFIECFMLQHATPFFYHKGIHDPSTLYKLVQL
jgi:hypothetical protein